MIKKIIIVALGVSILTPCMAENTKNTDDQQITTGFTDKDYDIHKSLGGVNIGQVQLSGGASFYSAIFTQLEQKAKQGQQRQGYAFSMPSININFNVQGNRVQQIDTDYSFNVSLTAKPEDNVNNVQVFADTAYLEFKNRYGTVQTGIVKPASILMSRGPLQFIGGTGGVYGAWLSFAHDISNYEKSSNAVLNILAPNKHSESWAISYYTPRSQGVQAGYTILPKEGKLSKETTYGGEFQNIHVLSTNYKGSIVHDYIIECSASAIIGKSTARTKDKFKNLKAYSIGAIVKNGEYSIGAEFMNRGDSRVKFSEAYKWVDGGIVFTFGIGYSLDKHAVSLSYYQLKQRYAKDTKLSKVIDINTKAYSLTYDYLVQDEIKLFSEITSFSSKQAVDKGNNGHTALVGIAVAF